MSGLKTTSKSDWKRVQTAFRDGAAPADDPDAPNFATEMRTELSRLKPGRVLGSGTKEQVTMRIDSSILDLFKKTGKGWQTRVNDALRTFVKEHPLKPV